MIYWRIYYEFFKIGLFAIGGGYATLPFLYNIAKHFKWFPLYSINHMLAVSSISPGPTGVSLATLCGLSTAGFLGAIIAAIAIVTPSVLIITLIARKIKKYKDNFYIQAILYGLRPCALALLTVVCFKLMKMNVILHGEIPIAIFLIISVMHLKIQDKPLILLACAALLSVIFQFVFSHFPIHLF